VPDGYAYNLLKAWAKKTGGNLNAARARLDDLLKLKEGALGKSDIDRLVRQVENEIEEPVRPEKEKPTVSQEKVDDSLWAREFVPDWVRQQPEHDEVLLTEELLRALKDADHDREKALETVRAVHGFDTPWSPFPEWRIEPRLAILTKKVEREPERDGETVKEYVDRPVEPAYQTFNDLVARHHLRPFITVEGQPLVAYPSDYGVNVVNTHDARGFIDQIGHAFWTKRGFPVPAKELAKARVVFEQRAKERSLPTGRRVRLSIRVASAAPSRTRLDLNDERMRSVLLMPGKWEVETTNLPVFWRPRNLLPLPMPTRNEKVGWQRVERLWFYARIRPRSETDGDPRLLVLTTLVLDLIRPDSPKVLVVVEGGENDGKTSTHRFIVVLVDPAIVPLVRAPETEKEFDEAVWNRHILSFDNVSWIPPWMSDQMCQVITGIGISKRQLFTDSDDVFVDKKATVVINGLTAVPNKPDLLRRTVFAPIFPPATMLSAEELSEKWTADWPEMLGGLLDLAVAVLGILETDRSLAGGADFVRVGRATALAMGRTVDAFDSAWAKNVEKQGASAAEVPMIGLLIDYWQSRAVGDRASSKDIADWVRNLRPDIEKEIDHKVNAQTVGNFMPRAQKTMAKRGIYVVKRIFEGNNRWIKLEKPETGSAGPPLETFSDDTKAVDLTVDHTVDLGRRSTDGELTPEGPEGGGPPISPAGPPNVHRPGVDDSPIENEARRWTGGPKTPEIGKLQNSPEPDPEDLFAGRKTRADRARAKESTDP
jgi:hypothetical protein